MNKRPRVLGFFIHRALLFHLFLIVILSGLAACSGGSGSDPDHIATDAEIVALSDDLIEEIESESSPDQLSGFQEIAQTASGYDYTLESGPGDPGTYIVEPSDQPQLYAMHGVIALLNGSRAAALWCSLQAVRLRPADPELLAQAGVMLLQLDENENASTFLRKAVHLDAAEELYHLSLSTAYENLGRVSDAVDQAQEAIDLAPDNLVVKNAVMHLFMQELPQAVQDHRAEMLSACTADLLQAVSLKNIDEVSAYTQATMDETSLLNTELMNHTMTMPTDFPMGFIEALSEKQEHYMTEYQTSYVDRLNQDLDDLQDHVRTEQDGMAIALGDCCEATNYACYCFYDYCTSNLDLLEDFVFPTAYEALDRFLPGAIVQFKDRELATIGLILRNRPQLSDSSAEWSARFEYLLLALHCRGMGQGAANALGTAYAEGVLVNANCQMEPICRTAEEEARQAERQQRIEAERLAEEALLRKKAEAKQKAQETDLKGELCLDSVGCLGIDGSKLTVKVGGPVFASLTVDTDKLSVGVRAGVGISDPSGGNLGGADLSVGGEISSSGSSFDVRASYSMAAGTKTGNYTLFGIASN